MSVPAPPQQQGHARRAQRDLRLRLGEGGARQGLQAEAVEHTVQTCAKLTPTGVMWQTIIHTIFILSALGIALTDRVMNPGGGKSKAAH